MSAAGKKPHLNLIIIGHVDHGKSTLTGHTLVLTGKFDERTLAALEEDAKKMGKESFKFAWVMDRLKEERERGLTIDLMFLEFTTPKYFFTIIDAPGHRDFVKNMITGASQADAAILVISSKKGEFEVGVSATGQTREHAFLARTLGINQLIVAVNKMDDATTNWSEARYNEVKDGMSKLLKAVGYDPAKIKFIPVSGWLGDNIIKPSANMPWYKGPTLVEAFDTLESPPKPTDKPLRVPVQEIMNIPGVGVVPVGRVESGVLKVNDNVSFNPGMIAGEVKSIETHHVRMDSAEPGDNIGFNVKGPAKGDLMKGMVCAHPNHPAMVADEFVGQIIVIYHPTAIGNGYTPVIHIHTANAATKFEEIQQKIDPRSGAAIEEKPAFIKQGDAAVVRLKPVKPIVVEKFNDFPPLGRFAVRDSGRTVAAGIVKDVTPAKAEKKGKA